MTYRRSTDDDGGDGRSGPRPSGIVCLGGGFFLKKIFFVKTAGGLVRALGAHIVVISSLFV